MSKEATVYIVDVSPSMKEILEDGLEKTRLRVAQDIVCHLLHYKVSNFCGFSLEKVDSNIIEAKTGKFLFHSYKIYFILNN